MGRRRMWRGVGLCRRTCEEVLRRKGRCACVLRTCESRGLGLRGKRKQRLVEAQGGFGGGQVALAVAVEMEMEMEVDEMA